MIKLHVIFVINKRFKSSSFNNKNGVLDHLN